MKNEQSTAVYITHFTITDPENEKKSDILGHVPSDWGAPERLLPVPGPEFPGPCDGPLR